ncbi:hypothetical protein ACFW04_001123 [Cataglyphis niger]
MFLFIKSFHIYFNFLVIFTFTTHMHTHLLV